jgi:hypothetical protein
MMRCPEIFVVAVRITEFAVRFTVLRNSPQTKSGNHAEKNFRPPVLDRRGGDYHTLPLAVFLSLCLAVLSGKRSQEARYQEL